MYFNIVAFSSEPSGTNDVKHHKLVEQLE